MPWTIKDVDEHKKGLTPIQKKKWVEIANKALSACIAKGGTDQSCAPKAIIVANKSIQNFEVSQFLSGPLVKISNMEIFKTGKWNGMEFNDMDLDMMASNFNELKFQLVPKLKITHREDQESLAGLASYGDIVEIRSKKFGNRTRLFADIEAVPLQVAEWIRDKRFAERSIELTRRFSVDGKEYKNVITAVSLLGNEIPAVAGMAPVELKKEDNELNTKELVGVSFDLEEESFSFQIEEVGDEDRKKKSKNKGGDNNMDLEKILNKISEMEETITGFAKMQKEAEDRLNADASKKEKAETEKQIEGFKNQITELEKVKSDYEAMKEAFEKKDKEHSDLLQKNKEIEVNAFIKEQKSEGKILPAFEAEAKELLMSLNSESKVGKFSKVDEKGNTSEVELTSFEVFQNLLRKLPSLVKFKETTHQKGGEPDMDVKKEFTYRDEKFQASDYELAAEAEKYQKEHKCSYEDAIVAISKKFKEEGKSQALEGEE